MLTSFDPDVYDAKNLGLQDLKESGFEIARRLTVMYSMKGEICSLSMIKFLHG